MPIDAHTQAAVRRAVEALLPNPAMDLDMRPLSGGTGNRSWLVRTGEQRWVVRLPSAASAGSVLDVVTEHRVTARAAAAGLAPAVVAGDPATGVLITRHIPHARTWTVDDARADHNIVRLAAHLRALHGLHAGLAPFGAARVARRYRERAADAEPLAPEQARWGEELLDSARHFDQRHAPAVLCHNDLVAANVLDDGNIFLVDFEYAVHSAPILDLAGVAGMNDFDAERRTRLVEAYFAGAEPAFDPQALDETVRLVRLLAFFWAVACRVRAEDPDPYIRFGEQTAAVLRKELR